jgi:GNAT superfamily N-acetyltransferase
MEFRTAAASDAEPIFRLWRESGASMRATDTVDQLCRVVSNPAAILVLALIDDEIIGTLLGIFDGWRGQMYRLVVHPSHRRQGIGRELVRQIERVFREWGVRRTTALIEVDRPWAIRFWTAVGYPRDEHVVRHVGELGESVESRPMHEDG